MQMLRKLMDAPTGQAWCRLPARVTYQEVCIVQHEQQAPYCHGGPVHFFCDVSYLPETTYVPGKKHHS